MAELVRIIENEARTTSLMVAEAFGKQHQHVTRSIREMLERRPDLASNFGLKIQKVPTGKGAMRESAMRSLNPFALRGTARRQPVDIECPPLRLGAGDRIERGRQVYDPRAKRRWVTC